MEAGKPKKQAVAIALATERKYSKGSRKSKLEDAYARYIEEKAWAVKTKSVLRWISTISRYLRPQLARVRTIYLPSKVQEWPPKVEQLITVRTTQIYKPPKKAGQDTIVFVLGLKAGLGNEEKQQERDGVVNMKDGLYANIHRKRARIKAGSGEKMRKVGSEGAPTAEAFKESAKTAKKTRKQMLTEKMKDM